MTGTNENGINSKAKSGKDLRSKSTKGKYTSVEIAIER
jgi:putative lipoic acid-binding regulatory protein